jgi:hypothetical protein
VLLLEQEYNIRRWSGGLSIRLGPLPVVAVQSVGRTDGRVDGRSRAQAVEWTVG